MKTREAPHSVEPTLTFVVLGLAPGKIVNTTSPIASLQQAARHFKADESAHIYLFK